MERFNSVESVDDEILKIDNLYNKIISKELISAAHAKRLFKYYKDIVDSEETLDNIAKRFGIPIIKSKNYENFSALDTYNDNRRQLVDFMKEAIDERLNNIAQALNPPTKVFPPAPKINKSGYVLFPDEMTDWDFVQNKPVDKLYLPDINEFSLKNVELKPLSESDKDKLRIEQLERENQRLKEYIKQIYSKRLVEEIPEQELKRAQCQTMNQNKDSLIDVIHE